MPQDLMGPNINQQEISPKFFDKRLTGSGKERGVLSADFNPANVIEPETTDLGLIDDTSHAPKLQADGVSTWNIFLNPIPYKMWERDIRKLPVGDLHHGCKIADVSFESGWSRGTKIEASIWVTMLPHDIEYTTKTINNEDGSHRTERSMRINYQLFTWYLPKDFDPIANKGTRTSSIGAYNSQTYGLYEDGSAERTLYDLDQRDLMKKTPVCEWVFTETPKKYIETLIADLDDIQTHQFHTLDELKVTTHKDNYQKWIENYSLYANVTERAREWNMDLASYVKILADNYKRRVDLAELFPSMVAAKLAHLVNIYETYKVPLTQYKEIYDVLEQNIKDDRLLTRISKNNLNLLLADDINALKKESKNLPCVPKREGLSANSVAPFIPGTNKVMKFSRQQAKAIESDGPLTLVKSGPGCGKSACVMGRWNYMVASGIKPEDILLFSFTNAAKKNLLERNPNVKSVTMNSMIGEIYSYNFPGHKIAANNYTLVNMLRTKNEKDATHEEQRVCNELCRKLERLEAKRQGGKNGEMAKLNTFIEANYNTVMTLLDRAGMTCYDIQLIVCYQKIESLAEPPEMNPKHLIIDEVQDNSIFEFVYSLRYTAKHQTSLFIVGDAAQCLYAFRDADPYSLSTLENTGLFDTVALDTNYRSKQEILELANVLLEDIDQGGKVGNASTNINLKSFERRQDDPVTKESFEDAVHIKAAKVKNKNDIKDAMTKAFHGEMKDWIDEKLEKGEKVCFLAYTRDEVAHIKNLINSVYPDEDVVSLVATRPFCDTSMTTYLARGGMEEMKWVAKEDLVDTLATRMKTELPTLVNGSYSRNKVKGEEIINIWQAETAPKLKEWCEQVDLSMMTIDELREKIVESIGETERYQGIKEAKETQEANERIKKQSETTTAPFIISTIHSAKGLEFDNVCVLYKETGKVSPEDMRMYYVAMTRPKNSLWCVACSPKQTTHLAVKVAQAADNIERANAVNALSWLIGENTEEEEFEEDDTPEDDVPTFTDEEVASNPLFGALMGLGGGGASEKSFDFGLLDDDKDEDDTPDF